VFKGIIDGERLVHSFKTALACALGFLLTRLVSFTADQWVIITIIVVMCAQIYVGSVIQKSYLRFLGTFAGCLLAIITIHFFGNSNLTILWTLCFSSFIFSYIATSQENMSYAGTLGAVTIIIIMMGQNPTPAFAIERFLEISVGLLIATLISQFILPIHARTHLRRSQAATLGQLRDYYTEAILSPNATDMSLEDHDLDESIVKSLLKQRQLAKESQREPLTSAFDNADFMQSLYCERELLRAIIFMHNALSHIRISQKEFVQSNALRDFNDCIIRAIDTIISAISSNNSNKQHIHIPALTSLTTELEKCFVTATQDDLTYGYGFLFSAETLINSLIKLAEVYGVKVYDEMQATHKQLK
jgi:uncharacterized membrane protein YccC